MNPEFRRNLWLELTPRRTAFMVITLALILFAAAISGGSDYRPAAVAEFLFYFIVVFWGSRNAALSVVGEIRDRTWDSQRLSSLGADVMTWGKLFGATAYNWLGGAICLAVLLTFDFAHQGPFAALIDLVYYLALGIISQAASLLASLIAVRRRQSHTRFEIFIYQVFGVIAACAVFYVWEAVDPQGSFLTGRKATEFILWWGAKLDSRPFLLVSLALFAGLTLVGCYREMRLELKMRNGPLVWLAFLLFIGLYMAGFDAWLSRDHAVAGWDFVALRLGLATTTFAVLTYATVLLEPKDRVIYRWLGAQFATGRIDRAFGDFQGWMMSFVATFVVAGALIFWLSQHADVRGDTLTVVSLLGFFTRDVWIFILFQSLPGRRRGDFAAVVALFALYVLIPAILEGLGLAKALPIFYPQPTQTLWFGAAAAWAQAIVVVALAVSRLSRGEKAGSVPAAA